jgi:dipeptidase E
VKLLLTSEFDVIFPKAKIRKLLAGYQKLLFIPTASFHEGNTGYFENTVKKQFQGLGIDATSLEITNKGFGEVKSAIDNCDIVYVGGGNTFYLLEQMKKCRFKDAMEGFFERGGIYIGDSAGAIVACPDIGYTALIDDPKRSNLKDFTGLNLIDMPILPHIGDPSFARDIAKISQNLKKEMIPAFELTNQQAIYSVDGRIEMIR